MTDQQQPYPSEDPYRATAGQPAAATAPAPESTEPGEGRRSSKARQFLAGAMLVTVGVVAGAGTTYAFTTNDAGSQQGQFSGRGGPGGGFGNGYFPGRDGQQAPPGMNGQQGGTTQGQQGQQGTAPSTAPSTQPSGESI